MIPGDVAIIKLLIENNADINKFSNIYTPLTAAISIGKHRNV